MDALTVANTNPMIGHCEALVVSSYITYIWHTANFKLVHIPCPVLVITKTGGSYCGCIQGLMKNEPL